MAINQTIVDSLKQEITKNPAADAVFHVLALRNRSRSTLTIAGLSNKMHKEGFTFDRKHYVDILKLLGKLGFGTLETTPKGKVKGLTHISVKLKSIGEAACNKQQETDLIPYTPKPKYKDLIPHRPKVSHLPPRRTPVGDRINSFFKAIGRFFLRISGDLPTKEANQYHH